MVDNVKEKNKKPALRAELRARLLASGVENMSETELAALLLSHCVSDEKASEQAERLIGLYGSLRAACDADPQQLMRNCGISESGAVLLSLMADISRRSTAVSGKNQRLGSPAAAKKYFSSSFSLTEVEKLVAVSADRHLRAKELCVLAVGSGGDVSFTAGEISRFIYKSDNDIVFIAHAHPTGSAAPSDSDIASTQALIKRLEPMGLMIADHIIVGRSDEVSMREWCASHGLDIGFPYIPGYGKRP